MLGMNQKMIGILAVCIVVGFGAFFIFKMPSKQADIGIAPTTDTETEIPQATTTSTSQNAAPVASLGTTKAAVKTYIHSTFGYSFVYPNAWVLDEEKSIVDATDQMPSIVSVHDSANVPQRFSVTINRNERTLKDRAKKTQPITIGGQAATAYLFPDGYGCTVSTEDPDCSFFLIPVQHNGVWYELTGANNAKTLDAYMPILASFTFTR